MSKERRKFKRFDAFMNIRFHSQQGKHAEGTGLTKDLCREGIRVNSSNALKIGDLLEMEIQVPDDTQPVQSTGKVMWEKPCSGRDQGIDYGVSFLMIDPIDKFRILDYAYNYWLETKVNDFSDPEKVED